MSSNLGKAFSDEGGHFDFEINNIEYEDDAESTPDPIEFEYKRPGVSVDVAGRFATHEIIGGDTVRQKIGENPVEVSVSGVVRESTAIQIDNLRDAKFGVIYSGRFPGNAMTVQFASSSTSPLSDGGAVGLTDDDAEFLYTFDLECVEISV